MKRKTSLSLIVGLCLVLILATLFAACAKQAAPTPTPAPAPAPAPAAPQVIELKFAHEEPPDSSNSKNLFIPWASDIGKATNGRVKVTIYPGEALGATDTYVEAVKSGMIDIAWISLEYFEGRWPLSMVGYYQLGAKTPGTMSHVWWDLYKEFPEIQAEFPGLKMVAVYGGTPKQIFTSKKYKTDVRTMDDAKGMKIKVGGGPFNENVVALGLAPVTIPAPQQYDALQKGTVDASWFELGDSLSFILQDVCRSVTVINAPGGAFALIMSPAAFAKLSAADQKIVDSLCGDAYIARAARMYYNGDNNAVAILTKAGVQVINPAAADYDAFQKALAPVANKWIDKTNALGKPATKVYTRGKEIVQKWEASKWWEAK